MKSTVVLISLIGVLQSLGCKGGGPSAYGYDASSVCNKPYNSRSNRAYLKDLPCDFRHQSWCTVAGSAYPWDAVRRFVRENQGLMRRMYGIDRQIDVLRAEFRKNDIELEFDEDYEQYLQATRRHQESYDPLDYSYDDELPSKRYINHDPSAIRGGKYSKQYPTKSYFRKPRVDESVTTDHTTTLNVPTVSSTTTSSTTENVKKEHLTITSVPTTTTTTTTTTISNIAEDSTTYFDKNVTAELDLERSTVVITTMNYTETQTNEDNETIYTTTAPFVDKIAGIHNLSINEISGPIDRLDVNTDELTEISEDSETSLEEDPNHSAEFRDEITPLSSISESEFPSTKKPSAGIQEFRPRPHYKPNDKLSTVKPDNLDVAEESKNEHQESDLKIKKVNACTGREEVVAPLWAHNTRGELLALINHHPFEQYVHWEKCTQENKQLNCRDGCRCEQQYHLLRLLAFDPSNECRGIFTDWFKFPSCCVCMCYNLPLELRVTSRSPRNVKRTIKIHSPRF